MVTFTVGNFTVIYCDTGNRYIPNYILGSV